MFKSVGSFHLTYSFIRIGEGSGEKEAKRGVTLMAAHSILN
jgi:hypothetical protein